MTNQDLIYTLALQRAPNIGDITAKKLIRSFGSAEAVLKASPAKLSAIEGIGKSRVKDLQNSHLIKLAEEELQFIQENDIAVSYFEDTDYPQHLKNCIDAPLLLFKRGNINLENKRIISIVGTRKATNQGIAFCQELIKELAFLNPVIVSGFAYGIDIAAHKAATENQLQTIACMAHGLNQIYPKVHNKYVRQVEDNGGFMTDFWSNATFDRNNFLRRNRIVAGISEATIVVESAAKGGSLVTADIANSYNREVFAVPGRLTDQMSKGCNHLIKTHQARLLSGIEDLVYQLNWDIEDKPKPQPTLFVEFTEEEQIIYDKLKDLGKAEIDQLALACEMPTFKLNPILLNLELKGVLRPLPGKLFEVI